MLGFIGNRFAHLSGTAFSIALVIALVGNMSVNYAMGFIAKLWGIRHLTTLAFAESVMMILLATLIFRNLKVSGPDTTVRQRLDEAPSGTKRG
jgi:hypothetical protein